MAVGSVLSGVFIIPWARARYSPEQITTAANLVLLLDCILMAVVHRPYVFLAVAALGGGGWTLSASELWVASQRAMPDWARGRMNATIIMVAQGATALGGMTGADSPCPRRRPCVYGGGMVCALDYDPRSVVPASRYQSTLPRPDF